MIYTITALGFSPTDLLRLRTMGYCTSLDHVERILAHNQHIHLTETYPFAVVERVEEGVAPSIELISWWWFDSQMNRWHYALQRPPGFDRFATGRRSWVAIG